MNVANRTGAALVAGFLALTWPVHGAFNLGSPAEAQTITQEPAPWELDSLKQRATAAVIQVFAFPATKAGQTSFHRFQLVLVHEADGTAFVGRTVDWDRSRGQWLVSGKPNEQVYPNKPGDMYPDSALEPAHDADWFAASQNRVGKTVRIPSPPLEEIFKTPYTLADIVGPGVIKNTWVVRFDYGYGELRSAVAYTTMLETQMLSLARPFVQDGH